MAKSGSKYRGRAHHLRFLSVDHKHAGDIAISNLFPLRTTGSETVTVYPAVRVNVESLPTRDAVLRALWDGLIELDGEARAYMRDVPWHEKTSA